MAAGWPTATRCAHAAGRTPGQGVAPTAWHPCCILRCAGPPHPPAYLATELHSARPKAGRSDKPLRLPSFSLFVPPLTSQRRRASLPPVQLQASSLTPVPILPFVAELFSTCTTLAHRAMLSPRCAPCHPRSYSTCTPHPSTTNPPCGWATRSPHPASPASCSLRASAPYPLHLRRSLAPKDPARRRVVCVTCVAGSSAVVTYRFDKGTERVGQERHQRGCKIGWLQLIPPDRSIQASHCQAALAHFQTLC